MELIQGTGKFQIIPDFGDRGWPPAQVNQSFCDQALRPFGVTLLYFNQIDLKTYKRTIN